ncbi:hypothetical protein V8F20_009599 [Naviculisporaceae sp. PSN 640]
MNSITIPREAVPVRELGQLERLLNVSNTFGLYKETCVAVQYKIPLYLRHAEQHANLSNLFTRAVGETVLLHPFCQVSLLNPKSKTPSWGKLDTLHIRKQITWRTLVPTEDYEVVRRQVLKSQLDYTDFNGLETKPGWRITVLRESSTSPVFEVFFFFNHAHFDGRSGVIFHRDLLKSLNQRAKEFHDSLQENGNYFPLRFRWEMRNRPLNLPPPLEEMALFPTTKSWRFSYLSKRFCPVLFRKSTRPEWATVWPRLAMGLPYETGIRTIVVPRGIVIDVLTACRQKGNITITSLLHALTAVSLARQIPANEMPAMKSITTIDLRRHMPNPQDDTTEMDPQNTMANIVSRLTHRFDPSLLSRIRSQPRLVEDDDASSFDTSSVSSQTLSIDSSKIERPPRRRGGEPLCPELWEIIWKKAEEVRGEIEHKLNMGLKNEELSMMRFVKDWQKMVLSTLHRPRAATFLISNLVVLDDDSEPPSSAPLPLSASPLPPLPTAAPTRAQSASCPRFCVRHGNPYSNGGRLREQSVRHRNPYSNGERLREEFMERVRAACYYLDDAPGSTRGLVGSELLRDRFVQEGEWAALEDRCSGPSRFKSKTSGPLGIDLDMHAWREKEEERKAKEKEEQFAIKRASFTLSAHLNGAGIQIGVVSVRDGDMVIDLSWHKGAVEDAVMETLAEDLYGWLRNISKGKCVDTGYRSPWDLESVDRCVDMI